MAFLIGLTIDVHHVGFYHGGDQLYRRNRSDIGANSKECSSIGDIGVVDKEPAKKTTVKSCPRKKERKKF